jgi:ribosomal protein L34E
MMEEKAKCRGCGMTLDGEPYSTGGIARIPETGKRAKVNHYGGWVCSRECDFRASLTLEQSMPGHNVTQKRLSGYAEAALRRNWVDDS